MISVRFLRDEISGIRGFEVTGHAGYAQHGHDIVCSAVSALCIAVANGLDKYCRSPVDIETGKGHMRVVSRRSGEASAEIDNSSRVLYHTLVDALREIAEQYPGRIMVVEDVIDS